MAYRILVVEGDLQLRRTVGELLGREGFVATTAGSAAEALAEVNSKPYDLVLLDVRLPDGDGVATCGRIRDRYKMPIILMSSRSDVKDRVAGLDTGADDYVVKPFELSEVVARIRAQLRRAKHLSRASGGWEIIRTGRLVVDAALQDAIIDGAPAGLTQKEFQVLYFLAARAGKAVSREALIERLWAEDELNSEKNLAVYIRRIRQKIERDPDLPEILLTVRGYGYRVAAA